MENIPVTFEYKGQTYSGYLSQVTGSASGSLFHLMIDKYYWGQLFYSQSSNKMMFYSNTDPGLNDLSNYFELVVTSYYQ